MLVKDMPIAKPMYAKLKDGRELFVVGADMEYVRVMENEKVLAVKHGEYAIVRKGN